MNNLEIIGNNYFGKYDFIREASRAVILKDDEILLSYETKNDIWMLPGGGKEIGETYRNYLESVNVAILLFCFRFFN